MFNPDLYHIVSRYAARCHGEQKYPGQSLPYFLHLAQVFVEVQAAYEHTQDFDLELAGTCALLHDVIEDTPAEYDDIEKNFGAAVADGVLALSKNEELPKEQQMEDSLQRILQQPHEIAIVKMADRSANLQSPPVHWSAEKREEYQNEAKIIWQHLNKSNSYLSARLARRIKDYEKFIKK